MLSLDRLASIAINALSAGERLAAGLCTESPPDPREIEAKLKEWRNTACEGDEALFVERLARDGLDAASVQCLLGRINVPSDFKQPESCEVLNQVIEATQRLRASALAVDAAEHFTYLKPCKPLPFEPLLLPFVEVAGTLLIRDGASGLSAGVLNAFARELLQKLTVIAARVLMVEFRAFLAWNQSASGVQVGGPRTASCAQYRLFLAKIYEDGWEPLFEEYCVMARLLATAVVQWVGHVREFEQRLANDLPEIETLFNRQNLTGGAVAVETGLADPHDGGRSVVSVRFSCGLKLVYKPRSLGLEKAYFDFAAWVNRCNELLSFRLVKVLDRSEYGWVEYVEHESCTSDEEIERYYRRAGHLLCLVYALNGTDFHFENLIADREYPVPIDLETIYHHRTIAADEGGESNEMAERLRVSVLSTDLLPDPVKVDHQYFDISALARSDEEEGESDQVVWTHVNTDEMDYSYQRQRPPRASNLPKLHGKVAVLSDHTESLLSGFEEAYRFLQDKRDVLSDEDGPLRLMYRQNARFIFRSTALYSLILQRALHPAYLRDGVDFGVQLDVLARRLLKVRSKPVTWPLLDAEKASLCNLDIPRFTARGDENALRLSRGNKIVGCFVDSAWNVTRAKIRDLNEADLRWQLGLITGSLDVRSANLGSDLFVVNVGKEHQKIEPPGRDELLNTAMDLANEIDAKAFRQTNGELGWMVLHYSSAAERYTLQPMEDDLYNGRAGVGLFFAALEKFRPGYSYRALAYASLAPIRRWIKLASEEEVTAFGFGGYSGMSSIVYALTRAGQFLDDQQLVSDALVAARRIRSDQIERDDSLDIMGGSAGAILGLLACHAATGEPQVLATAIACGRHLLRKRELDQFGFRTWPTVDQRHLTGFSHGAAGVAYALLQLCKASTNAEFHDAAVDAIGFEGRSFVPEHDNWRDYRRAAGRLSQRQVFSMAWCHGAPGIGLGRVAALDVMDTSDVHRDIQAALRLTSSVELLPRDHLCCGNAGLIDTLCTAGELLSQEAWSGKALQLAARIMARRNERGGFSIAFDNGFFNPSLFQGTAGIGYQLLRLAAPTTLPSVLLMK